MPPYLGLGELTLVLTDARTDVGACSLTQDVYNYSAVVNYSNLLINMEFNWQKH